MEWEFEAPGPVEAGMEVPAGRIDVVPAGGSKVVVDLVALGRRADELIEASDVSFENGVLRVHVPDRHFRNVDVRCTVSLPEGSSLTTRTASADVHCGIRLSRFSASTASGDMSVEDVDGDVSVKAASGDLHCGAVAGGLQVRTASGDVSVASTGGDAHVTLASGDLEIGEAAGSVRAESASGDVRIGRASAGRIQVSSASGDVTIAVAPGVGAYLDVTTVSGDSTTTLPFTDQGSDAATLEIVCRTVSGDVAIRRAS